MTIEKMHPTTTATTQGGEQLGRQVMALRYDLVSETLQGMLAEASRQAEADAGRGRPRLAGQLDNLRLCLATAVGAAKGLAAFCQDRIDEERAAAPAELTNHKGWCYQTYTQYDSDPRPYWSTTYAEYPPHPSAAYRGGEPELGQYRFLEPVFTSAQALSEANLAITDGMLRAFSDAAIPGAFDAASDQERQEIRQGLTKSLRALLAAARVQPNITEKDA